MSEQHLSVVDVEVSRQQRKAQKKAEVDAFVVQTLGPQGAKKWHDKIAKTQAKLDEITNKPLRPDLQASMDELREQIRASTTPYLQEECTLLGIEPGATKREVRNAYRRRARKLHPDVGGSEETFKQLQEAYHRLLKLAPME